MEVNAYIATMEEELEWRWAEVRALQNHLEAAGSESEKARFRKALVLLLYSHFEGFVKSVARIYGDALNKMNLDCRLAVDELVATSLDSVFSAYDNLDKKNVVFKRDLPNDAQLHRFSRQVEFVCGFDKFLERKVCLPLERVADTESNLWPYVLKKILFKLGLPHDSFSDQDENVYKLVNKRNAIAHGDEKKGLEKKEYDEWSNCVYSMMSELVKLFTHALEQKKYLKTA